MRATDLVLELVYPARNGKVLAGLLLFFLLLELAVFGGLYGLFLLALVIPAVVRYLMLVLETRSRGSDPGAPGIETFAWTDDAWSLFPVLHLLVMTWGAYFLGERVAPAAAWLFLAACGLLLPASLGVLAVTRSPAESLKPATLLRLLRRLGPGYLVVPGILLAAVLLLRGLLQAGSPGIVVDGLALYTAFAVFAVTGGLLRPHGLHAEVPIAAPRQPDAQAVAAERDRERENVLTHGYGFISRGNRAGGLEHICGWLERDPDPAAWRWFLERMLAWEDPAAGLEFARRMLGRLLREGREIEAVKLMLRCRQIDEQFRPLPGDRALALAAAERRQHEELSSFLR